jgi:site-specific DNA-methyltransferase (adenine-specific)
MVYNPQGIESDGIKEITKNKHGNILGRREYQEGKEYESFTGFPVNILRFPSIGTRKVIHPTEKPVELLKYLVKTYSSEGETVLDFTAGSFSTGLACMYTNRNFIGIESSSEYFTKAIERLQALNAIDFLNGNDIEICTLLK